MKVAIDFSIFSSPTKAFGRAYGQINVPPDMKIGDSIELVGDALELKTVTSLPTNEFVFGFSDLVFHSVEEAKKAALELENECKLFVDTYD